MVAARVGPQKAARKMSGTATTKNGNGVVEELILPSTFKFGEAMNEFVSGQSTPNSDEFFASSFSSFPSVMTFDESHGAGRFVEGIPLPNAINNLDSIGSLFEPMLNGYGGLLPFDSSKSVVGPPELLGRVVGKTRPPPPSPPPPPPPPQLPRRSHPREWMMMDHAGLSSTSRGSSQFSNELSLSLVVRGNSIPDLCSELSSSEHASCSSKKPLQLPPLLSGSRYLEAMQEILAGMACYALESFEGGSTFPYPSSFVAGRATVGSSNGLKEINAFGFQKQETSLEAKKKYLLALLEMVDEQYSQCIDEIHTVTSAFHAITELDPNLHARFALPTISLMYKNLRERISTQILASGIHAQERETKETKSLESCFMQKQWALQQLSKRDHQLWRPQRGLPETSVSVLRTWMFQNFLHPYPKDSEKHLLALKSGLTRNQVSNWFINARVRLWKPMIEEMCAEMNRRKARRGDEEVEGNHRNHMHLESRIFTRDSHG